MQTGFGTSYPTTRRIALFIPTLAGGGAERAMVTLANGFVGRGHRIDLLVTRGDGPCRDDLDPAVAMTDLGTGRTLPALPRLVRFLRRERPDALISALSHANVTAGVACALAGGGTRFLPIEQSSPGRLTGNRRGRGLLRLMRAVYHRTAHAVVACSHGVLAELEEVAGLPPGLMQVIPNPVAEDRIRRLAAQHIDHPWCADGLPLVVSAGRLVPEKDFATLLQAFARLPQPTRLVLLGEGPGRDALAGLARALGIHGRVEMPGFCANPYAWMRRASVFALSSRSEGLPTVLVEALVCGAPVVSTDCRSGPREILAGGRLGALVPVGDAGMLAAAIARAITNGRGAAPDYTPPSPHAAWEALLAR